jgi:hypothetical protein
VAAKTGLLGLPGSTPLFTPWYLDSKFSTPRNFSILTLKARSIGMSTLVAQQMEFTAKEMGRMSAVSIWNKGFKRDDVTTRLLTMKSNGYKS